MGLQAQHKIDSGTFGAMLDRIKISQLIAHEVGYIFNIQIEVITF